MHSAGRPGSAFQTDGVDLLDGPHVHGPHGRQGTAEGGEVRQADAVSFRDHTGAGPARGVALRAQACVRWRARPYGAVSSRYENCFPERTRPDQTNDRGARRNESWQGGEEVMSELLRWIMSPEWAQAVRALLHTL